MAKSSDLIFMVLDAAKEDLLNNHRTILEKELHLCGIRLNTKPADIYFKRKKTGGIKFNSTVKLTKFGENPEKTVYNILHDSKIHNADILFREDATTDQFIDILLGNRKYVKCLYIYNKVDMITIEDMDKLARQPNSLVCSVREELNLDYLLTRMWEEMGLVRVYTKKRGQAPDFTEPLVLSKFRHGINVEAACNEIHRSLVEKFNYAQVWGKSAKHTPQRCGLAHVLHDEDVIQVMTQTNVQQRRDKNYAKTCQKIYDEWHAKKKKKKPLKT